MSTRARPVLFNSAHETTSNEKINNIVVELGSGHERRTCVSRKCNTQADGSHKFTTLHSTETQKSQTQRTHARAPTYALSSDAITHTNTSKQCEYVHCTRPTRIHVLDSELQCRAHTVQPVYHNHGAVHDTARLVYTSTCRVACRYYRYAVVGNRIVSHMLPHAMPSIKTLTSQLS